MGKAHTAEERAAKKDRKAKKVALKTGSAAASPEEPSEQAPAAIDNSMDVDEIPNELTKESKKKSKKRELEGSNQDAESAEAPKRKKRKHTEGPEVAVAPSSQEAGAAPSGFKDDRKKKKDKSKKAGSKEQGEPSTPLAPCPVASTDQHGLEVSDKKQRKKEKKEKKKSTSKDVDEQSEDGPKRKKSKSSQRSSSPPLPPKPLKNTTDYPNPEEDKDLNPQACKGLSYV